MNHSIKNLTFVEIAVSLDVEGARSVEEAKVFAKAFVEIALVYFLANAEEDAHVNDNYRRKLCEAFGVVASDEDDPPMPVAMAVHEDAFGDDEPFRVVVRP